MKEANDRDRRLLRARRERPCGSRTADERDKIASPHRVPQPEGHTLSYCHGNAVLCITAKLAQQWQIRVIHVISAILACPVRPKSGRSANARVYKYTP